MNNYGLQFKIKTKYINSLNSRNQTNNVVFNDYILISVAVATSFLFLTCRLTRPYKAQDETDATLQNQ